MIESITITNFQKHSRRKILFDKHVTTIVGDSDAGKSAILRALRWLCFNRPLGTAFIKDGEEEARVTLCVDDYEIIRRNGKVNRYALRNNLTRKITKYTAFGTGVPEDIQAILNLGTVNTQDQHDAPFWFSESAGEVSKQLNEIIDLSVIDTTLGELRSRLKQKKAAVGVWEKHVTEAGEELRALDYVEDLEDALLKLECKYDDYEDVHAHHASLVIVVKDASMYAKSSKLMLDKAVEARKLVEMGGKLLKLHKSVEMLESSLGEMQELTSRKKPVDFSAVHTHYVDYEIAKDRATQLQRLLNAVFALQDDIQLAEKERTKAQRTLEKESEGICPLCNQELL